MLVLEGGVLAYPNNNGDAQKLQTTLLIDRVQLLMCCLPNGRNASFCYGSIFPQRVRPAGTMKITNTKGMVVYLHDIKAHPVV